MATPGIRHQGFPTSAALQEFLLTLGPGGLVVVPQMRLAHQVWRRQRQAARTRGLAAWEPLAMTTLTAWWQQLWQQAWLPSRPASVWQRLVFWLNALEATPFQGQTLAELVWAALLDETYDLWQRYQLPAPEATSVSSPLIAWRQAVFQNFTDLTNAHQVQTGNQIPRVLLQALTEGKIDLPDYIVVVGLETPAPVEEQWLQSVARWRPLLWLHLWGPESQEIYPTVVPLPDQRQEMEWVVAQVLKMAQEVPLHRLAITAANLADYLEPLRRIFAELLGPPATAAGGCYNFSLGSTLAQAPLFQAALLPLTFRLAGEQRQDLLSWLQSPYYGVWQDWQKTILAWDWTWRQENLGYGWPALKTAGQKVAPVEASEGLIARLDQALGMLPAGPITMAAWQEHLRQLWQLLRFPHCQEKTEFEHWRRLQGLLTQLAAAAGDRPWSAASLVEWLSWGAARQDLPGEGSGEAGIQIQGLLELRGLDYEAVFCLGLHMGQFPPPPRTLPLLTSAERAVVLGGTYTSQHKFAEIAYRSLLAAAPRLTLTWPCTYQEEEQIGSELLAGLLPAEQRLFSALSHLDAGWLRSPAVRAAFGHPKAQVWQPVAEHLHLPLPAQMSLTALEKALACPCQFLLGDLLGIEPLPEVETGLTSLLRGQVLHQVVYIFTRRFADLLAHGGTWDDAAALELLQAVAVAVVRQQPDDPHWQAELARWLAPEVGLLRRWLAMEKDRYREGWRWLAMEQIFAGLQLPGWPATLRGRLDRIDLHPEHDLMIWDYKTGEIPSKKALCTPRRQFQLAGYLAAVQQRRVKVPRRRDVRAGIIGLKSIRQNHLKFEDYSLSAADWQEIVGQKMAALSDMGRRLGEGNFAPDPEPPPPNRDSACRYCAFDLLCGFAGSAGEEEES